MCGTISSKHNWVEASEVQQSATVISYSRCEEETTQSRVKSVCSAVLITEVNTVSVTSLFSNQESNVQPSLY